MKKFLILSLSLVLCACSTFTQKQKTVDEEVEETTILIAAAASLENAFVDELIPMFEEENVGIKVEGTYDSSGKLQKQIEEGLEADLFFSAATKQMNALNEEGLIDTNTIVELLQNKLVLIKAKETMSEVIGIDNILDADTIAIGDPQSVPAGQYAQAALEKLGIFEDVSAKASLATNVTEVLSWVSQGSAEVGLVYSTDAISLDNIELIEAIEDDLVGSKIVYPVALTANTANKAEAEKFLEFLQSEEAKVVFESYGFSVN